MNVFEYLSLRYQFEELTLNLRVPGAHKAGTEENLRWFLDNAEERNKRKSDYKPAKVLATKLIEMIDNDPTRKTRNGRRKSRTKNTT